MTDSYFTYQEILSQPEAWGEALEVALGVSLPKTTESGEIVFTGCGSAFYLATAAASVYQELTACIARAVPAGELLFDPGSSVEAAGSPMPLVVFSRSGTTTESLKAAEQWKMQHRGQVFAISTGAAALSRLADAAILIPKAHEQSIAQTRAFTAMYLAAVALSARIAGRPDIVEAISSLPESGRRIMHMHEATAQKLGTNLELDRFYFLGSGIRHGLACEAGLKMKEMTLTHSEAFHFLEFRHGPMSMVNAQTAVIGLLSDKNRKHEMAVLNEMKDLGATILTLAEADADLPFGSGVPESGRAVLYLPCLQLMAFHRSVAKGLNPDRPRYLAAAVHLDL
jgi:glucosamine--fructose-6-phosphate aminotransferase (isomerizing)